MLNGLVKDVGPSAVYAFPMDTMGARIRTLREARGLSQEGLGREVGVSKSAVSQWEDDSTKNIKLVTFLALVEALRTDYEYLVYGADRGRPGPAGPSSATGRFRAVVKK